MLQISSEICRLILAFFSIVVLLIFLYYCLNLYEGHQRWLHGDLPPLYPRLFHLCKYPHLDGYGFSFRYDTSLDHYVVSSVEPNFPAYDTGMKGGSLIFEVNGKSIRTLTRGEVKGLLVANPMELMLLVMDPEAAETFEKVGVEVDSQTRGIQYKKTADYEPDGYCPAHSQYPLNSKTALKGGEGTVGIAGKTGNYDNGEESEDRLTRLEKSFEKLEKLVARRNDAESFEGLEIKKPAEGKGNEKEGGWVDLVE